MNVTINNREIVRKYKSFKDRLIRGEINELKIKQGDEGFIVMKFEKKKTYQTAFEKMLELVEKNPVYIERPEADLFDRI